MYKLLFEVAPTEVKGSEEVALESVHDAMLADYELNLNPIRCKYSMKVGEDFQHVAGLFEMDWIRLFALNPTHISPESAVTNVMKSSLPVHLT